MGIPLSWPIKAGRIVWDKVQTGETWYEEHVAEPLLEEVEEAKSGSFPGEYGSRSSKWEEAVSAPSRRKSNKLLREAASEYTEELSTVESLEQKRIGVARHFIENLPGGEISGSDVLIFTHMTSVEGARGPAEPRLEKGDFDKWLKEAWSAFEEAEDQDSLERQLEALAERPENTLDPEVFHGWEDQIGEAQWPSILWNEYDDEYLPRYRTTLNRLEGARMRAEQWANEVDSEIEARI